MRRLLLVLAALLALPGLAAAQGTATSQVAVTPNAAAYVSGQCLGGVLAVPAVISTINTGGTLIASLAVVDPTGANAAMDVLLFTTLPTGTYTDHANCNVAAADRVALAGVIPVAAFTCVQDQSAATGICQANAGVPLTLPPGSGGFPATGNTIWAVPIIRATPTYGAAKTLYFNFKAFPD